MPSMPKNPSSINSLSISSFSRTQNSVCTDIQGVQLTASPDLAAALLKIRPNLAHHACKSAGTGNFKDRLVGALLPHVVEHVAIDLLVELTDATQTFAGATTWLDRETNTMCVRVGCTSDEPSLYFGATEKALEQAVHLLNRLLSEVA